MEKTNAKSHCLFLAILLVLSLSTIVFSQDASIKNTQSLVRNLICLLLWVMPFIILLFFTAGSYLILSGSAASRNTGKKMIRNASVSLVIMVSLMLFVYLALPGVDVMVCFGALPGLENQPPVAEARVSYNPSPSEKSVEITVGDTAYFDANLSKDPDGIVVEYLWDYGDGNYSEGFYTDHVYTAPGEYYVQLRVRDDRGVISLRPSIVRVIVNPPLRVSSEIQRPVYETIVTTTLAPYVTTTNGEGTTSTTSADSSTSTSSGDTSSTQSSTTTTSTTTTTTTTTTTLPVNVLIAALKANMKKVYSDAEITTLEGKIKEYQTSLKNDGLNSLFLYLDEDATSNITGSKVTSPADWNNVDGILDQVTTKLPIQYVLIVGGYDRFPAGKVGAYKTDNYYADNNKDAGTLPDVALGRLPDPNGGDMSLLITEFDTYTKLHNSGGLALPLHVGRSLGTGYRTMCFWDMIFGKTCASDANCKESTTDSPSAVSGKDFFYLVQHGSAGPPQQYANALLPSNLASMDVSNAVWMMVPCYGGVIDYASTASSIVLSYLKKGGAVHMSSTEQNCCSTTGGTCTNNIDSGVGLLYYKIAKKYSVGTRIGDAYKQGKTEFKNELGNGPAQEYYINCLYGDPTLKITTMW